MNTSQKRLLQLFAFLAAALPFVLPGTSTLIAPILFALLVAAPLGFVPPPAAFLEFVVLVTLVVQGTISA